MKRRNGISCATCGHAFTEDWGRGKQALRCGYEKNVGFVGRVTEHFPTGYLNSILSTPAPKWCALVKAEEAKTEKGDHDHVD